MLYSCSIRFLAYICSLTEKNNLGRVPPLHSTTSLYDGLKATKKFCNSHRKTALLESICWLSDLTPAHVFSCEYCQIFGKTYVEEHQRMATSDLSYFNQGTLFVVATLRLNFNSFMMNPPVI